MSTMVPVPKSGFTLAQSNAAIQGFRQNEQNKRRNGLFQQEIDNRTRKQDWVEGEGDRLIAEEQRKRGVANQRALTLRGVSDAAGGGLFSEFIASPEAQSMLSQKKFNTIDEQKLFIDQFAKDNKNLMTDPTKYRKTIYNNLLDKGWTGANADIGANNQLMKMFPTMDQETFKTLVANPTAGTGSDSNRSSGNGSQKLFTKRQSLLDDDKLRNNFMQAHGIRKGADTSPWDQGTDFIAGEIGGYSVNESTLRKFEQLGLKSKTSNAGMRAGIEEMFDRGGDTDVDLNTIAGDDLKKVLRIAKAYDRKQNESYGNGGSASFNQNANFARNTAYNSQLRNKLYPARATKKERLLALRTSLNLPAKEAGKLADKIDKEVKDKGENADIAGVVEKVLSDKTPPKNKLLSHEENAAEIQAGYKRGLTTKPDKPLFNPRPGDQYAESLRIANSYVPNRQNPGYMTTEQEIRSENGRKLFVQARMKESLVKLQQQPKTPEVLQRIQALQQQINSLEGRQ